MAVLLRIALLGVLLRAVAVLLGILLRIALLGVLLRTVAVLLRVLLLRIAAVLTALLAGRAECGLTILTVHIKQSPFFCFTAIVCASRVEIFRI